MIFGEYSRVSMATVYAFISANMSPNIRCLVTGWVVMWRGCDHGRGGLSQGKLDSGVVFIDLLITCSMPLKHGKLNEVTTATT